MNLLIIDDDYQTSSDYDSLKESGYNIVFCTDKDEAVALINCRPHIDIVVLDWYLEPDNHLLSVSVIEKIKDNLIVPIIIYTHHPQDVSAHIEGGTLNYPKDLIDFVDKINTDLASLANRLAQKNYATQIYNILIASLYKSTFDALQLLRTIDNEAVAKIFSALVHSDGDIDWDNDVVLSLIIQFLVHDNNYQEKYKGLIQKMNDTVPQNYNVNLNNLNSVLNHLLYSRTPKKYVDTGAIIRVNTDNSSVFGIVVTPSCDLVQKKTRYIQFIELVTEENLPDRSATKEQIKKNKHESFFPLPCVVDNQTYYAVIKANQFFEYVDETVTQELANNPDYPKVQVRLEYSFSYSFKGSPASVEYICTFLDPYRAALLAKKGANDQRVGTPDIHSLFAKAN